jgi:succinate dehydrogenase/fumarate reductase flavoprotein subunit
MAHAWDIGGGGNAALRAALSARAEGAKDRSLCRAARLTSGGFLNP